MGELWNIIPVCSGMKIDVRKGQFVDFFVKFIENEILSPGVIIDCNESLKSDIGNIMYSNLYRPMFRVVKDGVGKHDLVHP